jgi:hypothetical protein
LYCLDKGEEPPRLRLVLYVILDIVHVWVTNINATKSDPGTSPLPRQCPHGWWSTTDSDEEVADFNFAYETDSTEDETWG